MSDEPLSPERIAREAAEALASDVRPARRDVRLDFVAGIVRAAIERALRVPPVPGGLDEGRLAEIEASIYAGLQPDGDNRFHDDQVMLEDLRDELLRVYAVLRVYGDGEQAAYLAGFDAGRKARVSGRDPRDDRACAWCGQVKPTTVNETWSEAYPDGHLSRLCGACLGKCAGG